MFDSREELLRIMEKEGIDQIPDPFKRPIATEILDVALFDASCFSEVDVNCKSLTDHSCY